jgi:hypothetical protein
MVETKERVKRNKDLRTYRKFLKCFSAEDVVQIIRSVAKLVNLPLETQIMHLDGQINEQVFGNDLCNQKSGDVMRFAVCTVRPIVLILDLG